MGDEYDLNFSSLSKNLYLEREITSNLATVIVFLQSEENEDENENEDEDENEDENENEN